MKVFILFKNLKIVNINKKDKIMAKITDINICCDVALDGHLLDENDDYIQNLEFENKNMAEFLESLGYTQEQITDIALTGCLNLE